MKRLTLITLAALLYITPVLAVDFTFTAVPSVNIQMNKQMPIGFSGFLQADVNIANFMTVGAEGNYTFIKPEGFVKPIQLYGGGLNLGFYYYPLSRLYTGIGGGFGVNSGYINVREEGGIFNTYNPNGLYYRGYAELGFRFTPDFVLTATGGYLSYVKKDFSNFNNGIFAGVGLKLNRSVGQKVNSKAVLVSLEQYDDINPSFSRIYRDNECGMLTITNHESAEIRNVHIYFDAEKYTSSTIECGTMNRLNRYKKADIPLYIDFSDAIMNFTEDGMIPGTVIIEYELLGQKRRVEHGVTLKVRNRNAFVWNDAAALSTFVSSETPEIQNFAKSIAGIARNQLSTGMNRNLQFAAAMLVGLRCAGITYSEDTLTPYKEYHLVSEVDSILYPLQTMECLGGDYDDLGILLMSCLEAQGISCAYMALPDDFIVFVDLALSAKSAKNHFYNLNTVYVDEDADTVYLPLSMANFEGGFTTCRQKGAAAFVNALNDEDNECEFIVLNEAWSVYKPVVFNVSENSIPKPVNTTVAKQITTTISNYVKTDLNQIVKRLQNEKADPNQIGVALVRAMRYEEAKKEFQKSNTVSAMNNIANIYVIEKNYDAALEQYQNVLKKDPQNKTALAGIESLKNKLGM